MMKTLQYITVLFIAIVCACSPSANLTYSDAIFTEKDSVLIMNNSHYSSASLVGGGATLAKQEKDTLLSIQLKDLNFKLGEINGVNMEGTKDNGNIKNLKASIQDDILFPFASHELTESAFSILDDIENVLIQYPDIKITVVGHTDNVGTYAYNMTLSKNRASSVVNYFKGKGLNNLIFESGKGFNEPVADNNTDSGREKNRRVEIYLN